MTEPPDALETEREQEAWLAGFAAAIDSLGRDLEAAKEAMRDGEPEGVCDECGSEMIQSLGGGARCPECDL